MADNESIHQRIRRERESAFPDAASIKTYRAYLAGDQATTIVNPDQQRALAGVNRHRFVDNVCKMAVKAVCSRLQLVQWTVGSGTGLEAVEAVLSDISTYNHLPRLQQRVHRAVCRDGNTALLVSWDNANGRAKITLEKWWDGDEGIFVGYGEEGNPEYAVKEWKTGGRVPKTRRTVYFRDRTERYIKIGAGWRPYEDDPALPAVSTRMPTGEPLTLPVVHFAYPSDSDEPYGPTGGLLSGGLVGVQDGINDNHQTIMVAARRTGFQNYYGLGFQADDTVTMEPGTMLNTVVTKSEAEIGVLPAGDLSQLEMALKVKLQAVSRLTSVPLHEFNGEWPSGEALYRAEIQLVEDVRALGEELGPAWASVAHKATLLYNAYGRASLNADALITAEFAPPDKRDPLSSAQLANDVADHVSQREYLRLVGYARDEQDRILDERRSEDVIPIGEQ